MTRYVYTLNMSGYDQKAFTSVEKALEYVVTMVKNSELIKEIQYVIVERGEDGQYTNTRYYDPTDRNLWPMFKEHIRDHYHLQISWESEFYGGIPFLDKVSVQ